MTWPVGRAAISLALMMSPMAASAARRRRRQNGIGAQIDLADLAGFNANLDLGAIKEELALVTEACKPFELEAFREGHLTPVYFAARCVISASAISWKGSAASHRRRAPGQRFAQVAAEPGMSAFVFKIQANMDPNHRDRIAFARLCSGQAQPRHEGQVVRTGKTMPLSSPQFFFAQDRSSRTRPLPATSSAFPTMARCGSAIR